MPAVIVLPILVSASALGAGPSTSSFVISGPADLILSGGAGVQAAPLNSLRSGNPGARASATIRQPLNPGAVVERVNFAFRYDTGFGPTGEGANFSLLAAGQQVYGSPHYTDFMYSQNRSNYSAPVVVDTASLSIPVPSGSAAAVAHLEFVFDNNDRNLQLLLPLTVTLSCAGGVPCTPPPPPPPAHTLEFPTPPSIVAGPERPTSQGGGPWWDKVHPLSDTHALGWAESHIIATTDAGKSWNTLNFNDSDTCPDCDAKTAYAVYPSAAGGAGCGGGDCGPFRTLGVMNETEGGPSNVTGLAAAASTRYFLDVNAEDTGGFARELVPGRVRISGLPNLRMYGGSGGFVTLPDGSMVGMAKSTLSAAASPSGRLSAVAIRSTDGGFNWTFASVVASAEEVPYASEGPSEAALATLRNGTLMAVMRVDGQSGHYAPYVSKLSDDGGRSWHSLRSLRGGGSGGVDGAGCVRPRLLSLNGSLVLSGGRPNPLSRDVLVWLNAAGDGEDWIGYSISYWHNTRNTNANWTFPEAATNNSRSFPRLTTSYTSLVRTGSTTGYVLYGMGVRSFTLPFSLVPNPAVTTVTSSGDSEKAYA